MAADPFAQLKKVRRESWAMFSPQAIFTVPPAALLVQFAGIRAGDDVLDVACGTGVVAITAARARARVRGLDLAPALLTEARKNAALIGANIEFTEGDVEAMHYPDAAFDVVLSQFGHMFAPRPEVATAEMLRVLKPDGRIAFATWPPELFVGRLFGLIAKYVPPPPGAASPPTWGDPNIVRERLGSAVRELEFACDEMLVPCPLVGHGDRTLRCTLHSEASRVCGIRCASTSLLSVRKPALAPSPGAFQLRYQVIVYHGAEDVVEADRRRRGREIHFPGARFRYRALGGCWYVH